MITLAELYDREFSGHDDQLAKTAAAHGLSNEQYLEKVAEAQMQKEEMSKQASENKQAYGIIVSDGIKHGIANELNKIASQTGQPQAARNLFNLFCG